MTKENNKKVGRPSKFEAIDMEFVFRLAKLGLTDRQMAEVLDLSEATINNYKKKSPKFLESIKKGKEIADMNVERSLYERACGYSHPEDKFFQYNGEVITQRTIKQYPPDVGAAAMWLKNRAGWHDGKGDDTDKENWSEIFKAFAEIMKGKNEQITP